MKLPWVSRRRLEAAERLLAHFEEEHTRLRRERTEARTALWNAFRVEIEEVLGSDRIRVRLLVAHVVFQRLRPTDLARHIYERLAAQLADRERREALPPPRVH